MRHRPTASELLAWTLVGGALGIALGFAAGAWVGPVTRERAGDALTALGRARVRRLRAAEAAEAARAALAGDVELRALGLHPLAVGGGIVELHGWVPDRRLRARAARVVAAAPGIESLINCLLVHGEDDVGAAPRGAADRPA
jgi:hypothetical protein